MLEQVFHLLSGYVEFEVRGNAPRFFNVAAKSGFPLWGFRQEGEVKVCRGKAGDYPRLRPVCRRCKVSLRLRKKRGIPFQANRLIARKGLLIGAVLGIGLYVFLSGFVWGVSVRGSETVTDREILNAAARYGVYPGTGKGELNLNRAASGVLSQIPKLSWAAVNDDGCYLEIVVKEGEEKPEIADDSRWSNIVATREGRVAEIRAEHGRPEVSLGDTVEKGDLLISGLYQEVVDPWGPQPDSPLQTQGAARGSVKAETYREFTVQVSGEKKLWVPQGAVQKNKSLLLFGLRLPLGLNLAPQGEGHGARELRPLQALGTTLPVSLETETFQPMRQEKRTLSEEEMKAAALLKLRQAQRAQISPGGRVLTEELSYGFSQGICVLQAKCRCLEEIGEVKEILVE